MKRNAIRTAAFLLILCLAFGLAACGAHASDKKDSASGSASGAASSDTGSSFSMTTGNVEQIPNPFEEVSTLKEAEEKAGFSFSVPDSIDGYEDPVIRVESGDPMIELIYYTSDEKKEIRIRKAIGDDNISGDYTRYDESETRQINSCSVTISGNDGSAYNAVWTDGTYAFSITTDQNDMTFDQMAQIAGQMK